MFKKKEFAAAQKVVDVQLSQIKMKWKFSCKKGRIMWNKARE